MIFTLFSILEETFFAGDYEDEEATEKCCQLLIYVLDCLYKCFLYDSQRFVNKERFDRLLQPLVDQVTLLVQVHIRTQTAQSGSLSPKLLTYHLPPRYFIAISNYDTFSENCSQVYIVVKSLNTICFGSPL